MRMLRSNFEGALMLAIEAEEAAEKRVFPRGGAGSVSCFLEGLREVLEASKRGEDIYIEDA